MYKFTCGAIVIMCLLSFISLWSQITPQAGFPINSEEFITTRPIVTEDINPNYPGKELILLAGGYGFDHVSPFRLLCYSSLGEIIFENILHPFYGTIYNFCPAIADIDGNGSKEIILSYISGHNPWRYSLNILNFDGTNYGNGWPLHYNEDYGIFNISVGDIDNDGDLEIAAVINRRDLIIYHHDTTIVTGWPFTLIDDWKYNWSSPLIADLDLDNEKEVVFLVSNDSSGDRRTRLLVLNNQGVILPGWPKDFPDKMPWMSPIVADLNPNNNSLEIVVADNTGYTIVHVYNIDGSYAPGWPVQILPSEGIIYSENEILYEENGNIYITDGDRVNGSSPLTVTDLQQNGTLQVIVVGHNELHILNQDGTYYQPFDELIGTGPIYSPAVADLNGDGNMDIVFMTVENNIQKVYAYDNSGNILDYYPITVKEFSPTGQVFKSRINTPTLDDIDNDGDIEILVTAFYDRLDPIEWGRISVFDVPYDYKIQDVEWRTAFKNNWNNGTYCQTVAGTFDESSTFLWYDRIKLIQDVVIPESSFLKIFNYTCLNSDNHKIFIDGAINNLFNDYFLNTGLTVQNSDIELDYVVFDNSPIKAYCTIEDDNFVTIHNNCELRNTENSTAVEITNYPNFEIEGNIIENCHRGVYIYESGTGLKHTIKNNIIRECPNGSGIYLYHSYADIIGHNVIYNNYNGISLMRNCNFNLIGSEDYPLQIIRYNEDDEVLFTYDSRPGDFYFNKIYDNNHDDSYVYCRGVPPIHEPVDISNNNWGEDFNPVLDLYPYDLYIYLPIWDPGQPRSPGDDPARNLFLYGKQYEEAEDYVLAEQTYKQVISDFPESDYSLISAKELLALEDKSSQNYVGLKTYYETEPNMQYNDVTIKLSEYLSNYCDIKLENYPVAIECFEEIILDPPSVADSVLAVIDAGYTYLLMGGNGRGGYVGRLPELKPKSRESFEANRDRMLSDLLESDNGLNGNSFIPNIAVLHNNYPNPFNPETTISFSIPKESKVELTVYNIKSQKVKTLTKDVFAKGFHKLIWNGKDSTGKEVGSGVYFYKLNVNGITKQIHKCILMK